MAFKSYKSKIVNEVHQKAVETANQLGQELFELAQPVTPILYGDLRRSSHYQILQQSRSVTARVISSTPYARRQYYENANNPRWYEMAVSYGISNLNEIAARGMRL